MIGIHASNIRVKVPNLPESSNLMVLVGGDQLSKGWVVWFGDNRKVRKSTTSVLYKASRASL